MTGIKDVAREAGVSVSTVSYVLSGKRSISAKTTDKVMAAVERLGYTPDASARKMRGMRNHILRSARRFAVISIRPNTTLTFCRPHGRQRTVATMCCCLPARTRWPTFGA